MQFPIDMMFEAITKDRFGINLISQEHSLVPKITDVMDMTENQERFSKINVQK